MDDINEGGSMTIPLDVFFIESAISGCTVYMSSPAYIHAESLAYESFINNRGILGIFSVLFLFLLAIVVFFLIRSKSTCKKMKEQIDCMEQELAIKTGTLSTLYDSVPDLIFIKDLDFRYSGCNKSFLRFFSMLHGDIIGKDDKQGFSFHVDKLEEIRNCDQMVINTARPYTFEEYIPSLNGEEVLFETVKAPLIVNGSVIGIIGVAHEVTKYKKLEDEALAALCEKSLFISCLNSEVKSVLNSIIGFAELAKHFPNPPETTVCIKKMSESSNWLLRIVNTIIDISKIETTKKTDDSNVSR